MAKKVVASVKLNVRAGQAKPSPPIGPALGQRGLNIMEFCKQFNARTQEMEPGIPLPVVITAYADRSFSFEIKTPPTAFYLKRAANISGGSAEARRKVIGKVTMEQVRDIAEKKWPDLNCYDMDTAQNMVIGSAKSMGIQVVE